MIQANELRIGNLLKDAKGRICEVLTVSSIEGDTKIQAIGGPLTTYPIKHITLTEEILLYNCGAIEGANKCFNVQGIELSYITTDDYFQFEFQMPNSDWRIIDIKYLNQLQNLYFVLTGKELEVKL